MSKQKDREEYLTFTKQQGVNFLEEIEKIVKDLIFANLNRAEAQHEFDSIYQKDIKNKYRAFTDKINNHHSPGSTYYLSAKDHLYGISNTKECYGIRLDKIQNLLKAYFSDYDFYNTEKNPKDIGRIESLFNWEITERNKSYIQVINTSLQETEIKENKSQSSFDENLIKKQLERHNWALYTYGEKTVDHQAGFGQTRIYYIKERPVEFKGFKITLKNRDGIKIVLRKDVKNRNGIVLTETNLTYKGDYHIFERENGGTKSDLYLETETLVDDNKRHFKFTLALGKNVDEIGLGTFSLIKDLGTPLAGAAVLVRREANYYDNNKCKFYNSFKDDSNLIPKAIRILLEKRSRSYVNLPKALNHYTLEHLLTHLIKEKEKERTIYESRDVTIHRKDAFVSIPLNCNGQIFYKKYDGILRKTVQILGDSPFNLSNITFGTIKQNSSTNPVERPGSKEEYESNFDRIIKSNLVIFIFPPIAFPFEADRKASSIRKAKKETSNNISTSFMEMGFAIGLRKKILIITSEKVFKTFPSIIKKFAEGEDNYVKIIKCKVDTETHLSNSFKSHEKDVLKFLDTHLDYEIIEE